MLVLHVNWAGGGLRLWAESLPAYHAAVRPTGGVAVLGATHPFAVETDALGRALLDADLVDGPSLGAAASIRLVLPCGPDGPRPSDRLSSAAGEFEADAPVELRPVEIPAVTVARARALGAVLRLEDGGPTDEIAFGHSLRWWIAVARFVLELLADQRFIPTLIHAAGDGAGLRAAWRPWILDESARDRMAALTAAMPPVVRAVDDPEAADPWRILCDAVATLGDATIRQALIDSDFIAAIDGRDAEADPSVAWLTGLLDRREQVPVSRAGGDLAAIDMLRQVRLWLMRLEDGGRARPFRLGFRLREPGPDTGDDPRDWWLGFHLRLEGEPPVTVPLDRVWAASPAAQVVDGHPVDRPQELVLAELGRASRVYPRIESALSEAHPEGIRLTTEQAAQFLREDREVLEESGFDVAVPEWWGKRSSRLGVRLQIDAPNDLVEPGGQGGAAAAGVARLGLGSLVRFRWQLAVGDQPLTAEELRRIAESSAPLVRIADRWVEKADALTQAVGVMQDDAAGEVTLRDAIRLAQGAQVPGVADTGLPVLGLDAHGWVGRVLGVGPADESRRPDAVEQPASFHGQLRPYQKTGLGWLNFLEQFGFGACLADDMGLGKTIQLIALLLCERETPAAIPGATLLVVPTSLIRNWVRELDRFGPSLTHHVHHGPQRLVGEAFAEAASRHDVVITTYAIVARDRETIGSRAWWRVVLDEAQFIKNPPTQQASAIRDLDAERRVALTGTPVENRLTELWSIMEFCNPGYLGPGEDFRRRCAVPIERHRDVEKAESLRRLVHPFILRRLKTDPAVIVDLPPCTETKEYATLTPHQAGLYQAVVEDLLAKVDDLQGIQRRGRVLAALTRLKQICNHPAQLPDAAVTLPRGGPAPSDDLQPLSARSGKCRRLMEMLEEILAAGDSALVFTQYRRMGHLLAAMIRQDLDTDTQFMHGGTTPANRQEMIDRFQQRDGSMPVFILSLKTGGIGLNLTAANHVFHFDRWWNPAVENQATDRAYRIGQTRPVQVHKFVCVGTLEERIDQMIEQKTELAENVISSGEQWLTELNTQRLEEILRLRADALEVEA